MPTQEDGGVNPESQGEYFDTYGLQKELIVLRSWFWAFKLLVLDQKTPIFIVVGTWLVVFCSKNSKTEMKQYPRLTFIVLGQAQRKPDPDWMGGNCPLCIVWYLKSTGRLEKSSHPGGLSRIDRWCFLRRCHQTGMSGWDQDHNKMLWLGKVGSLQGSMMRKSPGWWAWRNQGWGCLRRWGARLELSGGQGWSCVLTTEEARRHLSQKRVMSSHKDDQTNQGHWQSQTLAFLTYISVTHPPEDIWDASV